MLTTLTIRDIVLIDQLTIPFSAGLTVLTGETGAGKSILLDSLSLALGGRGDGGLVREGEKRGQVTAVFDLADDHPVFALLHAHDVASDGEVLLRRVQSADGRTRAYINDQPVSVALLRQVGDVLVEIHGQHDDRALVDGEQHRDLLDAFGTHQALLDQVGACWKAWRKADKDVQVLTARIDAARKEADFLTHAVDELDKLGPLAGEEDELAKRRADMMQAEKVAGDLQEALALVSGPSSAGAELSSAMRRLERKNDAPDSLVAEPIKALDRALIALDEAGQALDDALRASQFNPHELEETEERLFALRAAARKYDVPADDLATLQAKYAGELATLDAGEHELADLTAALAKAEVDYWQAARALSSEREAVARQLEAAVMAELPALKLEQARFLVHMESGDAQAGVTGQDHVAFWVQTNPGTRAGPILKVASGGELSRFLLALKVALADKGSAPSLVFDEIDTGVGGAVAEAIGRRLSRLSARVQVLSVTHAPQVAARANGHLKIAKSQVDNGERVATRVQPLHDEARREEIARMLAGSVITDEARAAAAQLIAGEPA